MQYLWIGLLTVVLVIAALLTAVLWNRWELHLHLKDKRLTLELRGLGLRRMILERDFSKQESAAETITQNEETQPKKKKENWFTTRLKADKKRIYDSEQGGYQPGGIGKVVGEYKEMWEDARETMRGIFDGLRYKVEVTHTEIRLDFGTGNPAHTGMAYSAVWGVMGVIYPLLCRHIKMDYPNLLVTPDFNEPRFDLELKSIIKVRPAHIIHAVLRQGWHMAVTYLKNKKGSGKHG